jgi:short-subunit dehydrogenase
MHGSAFQDKVVVITGASLGIGRELALQLAGGGAWLVLAARQPDRLDQTAEACRKEGGRCIAVPTDVADEHQCHSLIARTVHEYGRLDVLITNAGMGMRSNFDALPNLSVIKTLMNVNFWGCLYCIHPALPHLKAVRGRIVVVISGGGKIPTPGVSGYAASKWAMAGFSDTLRIELRQTGVTVTAAYPEWVATGISSRAIDAQGKPLGVVVSHEKGAMSAATCARKILESAADRRRDVMSWRVRLGAIVGPILPGLIDKVAAQEYA